MRVEEVVLTGTEYDTVPFPTPLFVFKVIQEAGVVTCQAQLEADVTVTVPLSAPELWVLLVGEMLQVQGTLT